MGGGGGRVQNKKVLFIIVFNDKISFKNSNTIFLAEKFFKFRKIINIWDIYYYILIILVPANKVEKKIKYFSTLLGLIFIEITRGPFGYLLIRVLKLACSGKKPSLLLIH